MNGTQAACGTCHANPPGTGKHGTHRSKGVLCDACHNTISNAGATAIVTPALHVNGSRDVRLKGGGSWNPATKSCAPTGCHNAKGW